MRRVRPPARAPLPDFLPYILPHATTSSAGDLPTRPRSSLLNGINIDQPAPLKRAIRGVPLSSDPGLEIVIRRTTDVPSDRDIIIARNLIESLWSKDVISEAGYKTIGLALKKPIRQPGDLHDDHWIDEAFSEGTLYAGVSGSYTSSALFRIVTYDVPCCPVTQLLRWGCTQGTALNTFIQSVQCSDITVYNREFQAHGTVYRTRLLGLWLGARESTD